MKEYLRLAMSYPITIVSIVVMLICLIWLYMIQAAGTAFINQMRGQQSEIRRVETLMAQSVIIPPERPDQPQRRLSIAINQVAIDQLTQTYEKMDQEAAAIFNLAVDINNAGHLPIDDNLFPSTEDTATPFEAKFKYQDSFDDMLLPYSPNSLLPRLNAGSPMVMARISEAMEREERQFLDNNLLAIQNVAQLSPQEQLQLADRKNKIMIDMLQNHANSIHIYASRDRNSADYPFHVGEWSKRPVSPTMDQIWEGQMGLWMQQDLVEAIARANGVSETGRSVLSAPVKRLLKMTVVPGYVGITTTGGLTSSGTVSKEYTNRPDNPMPDDFSIAPTGRRSNAIFDVRHIRLHAHMDFQKMGRFFDTLAKVNFATVLHVSIKQVDEYQELSRGFVYGEGDVVEVNALIETIWLRRWTLRYMPARTREELNIPPDEVKPQDQRAAPAPLFRF